MDTQATKGSNGKRARTPSSERAADRLPPEEAKEAAHERAERDGDAGGNPSPPPKKKSRKLLIIVPAVVLLIATAVGVYYFLKVRPYESTDDAYIDGHVIGISPRVSAVVAAVHVDDNQFVRKGDLLVELDPTDYEVALTQAEGGEAAAEGKLEQDRAGVDAARSAIVQARAAVDAADATFANVDADLKRYQSLEAPARSKQDLDRAVAARQTALAAVEQAHAQLQAAQSQLESAKANVIAGEGDLQKARADTRGARVNLGYCRIIAPQDGRITNKSVEVGAYVTPANPLFQIVPSDVWVTANFKETQLTHMRVGQPVDVDVDAYPHMPLHGQVDSIQAGTGSRFSIIPAENATGNFVKVVQRVPVKIRVPADANSDPGRLLSPGMSVEPSVRIR